MNVEVNKHDINKVLLKIAKLETYTSDELDKNFAATASAIRRRAKTDVPVQTRFLQSSINYGRDKNVYVEAKAEYAPFVEFDTSKQKKKPYFYKNAEIELNLLYKRLARNIKRIIGWERQCTI